MSLQKKWLDKASLDISVVRTKTHEISQSCHFGVRLTERQIRLGRYAVLPNLG